MGHSAAVAIRLLSESDTMTTDAAGKHWSSVQRAAHERHTERYRCPKCNRGSALVWRYDGGERILQCRWIERGLCDYTHRFQR